MLTARLAFDRQRRSLRARLSARQSARSSAPLGWLASHRYLPILAGLAAGCSPGGDVDPGTSVIAGTGGTAAGGADVGAAGTGGVNAGGVAAGAGGTSGSSGSGFDPTGHGLPGAEPGSWTYLVYMVADNNLESFVLEDLRELMAVGSTANATFLVQVDRAAGETDAAVGGIADFTGGKRFRVEAGSLTELQDLGEINSGSGGGFSEFLTWGIQAAPADHYALELWDHGGAWGRFGADVSHQNDGLSLTEMSRALDIALAATGMRGPLDLIGFDACLMGTWEVAVALQGRAHYLLASEELEPGHGWNHEPLAILAANPDAATLGSALIAGYAARSREEGTFPRATLALTDLSRLGPLSQSIEALSLALTQGSAAEHAVAVARSRHQAGAFGSVPRGTTASMVDIGFWTQALALQDPELAADVANVRAALTRAVVDQVVGDAYAGASGLSIYFPVVEEDYEQSYAVLAGVDAWRSFLDQYHAAGNELTTAPRFIDPNRRVDLLRMGSDLLVSATLAPDSLGIIASTTLDVGLVDGDGAVSFLGEQPATLYPDGVVSAFWDERVLRITQGGLSEYAAYVIDRSGDDVRTLSIPLEYTDDDEVTTVVLMAAVDADGAVLSRGFYSQLDGAWAEHPPAPGSTLAALVPTLISGAEATADIAQSTTFDGEEPLDLDFVNLGEDDDIFVRLRVTDYAGQTDTADNADAL